MTTLFIDQNGDLHAVLDPFVDSLDLGVKTVTRVSNVEFDNATQQWVALFLETGEKIVGTTRQEVIDKEIVLATALLERKICETSSEF